MNKPSFTIRRYENFIKITTACLLIFIIGIISFAQYKGEPVKKDRLIKALRSKQLQTRDIVSIIKSNGVDFTLTPEIIKEMVAAGARPAVINAISENLRLSIKDTTVASTSRERKIDTPKPTAPSYDDLLEQAMFAYKDQKNPQDAVQLLETAVKMKPNDRAAYQILGFVHLYGLNNLTEAREYMREAIKNGGSAVFRVIHDDNGNFTKYCTGSLYISPEDIRYESDDNIHTFETSTVNIDKTQLDRESSPILKNRPIFKVFLKIGNAEAKFRFSPESGKVEESNMIALFIKESQSKSNLAGAATNSSK
ncbi:hypothetical protein BH20ACI1_BH20ACI1_21920 [soil metagenome]